MNPKYLINIDKLGHMTSEEKASLKKVIKKYKFRANEYYLSLINWENPNDPIRKIIIPQIEELEDWGSLDASSEKYYTVQKGFQHKYKDTVLLLVNDVCGGFCRFCFRKRLFINQGEEISRNIESEIEYIENHKEITNVLLTGGDPLLLSTDKIRNILTRLRKINHIKIIRIGTKMFSFNPYRILEDKEFLNLLEEFSLKEKRIYFMMHFNHPKEIQKPSLKAIDFVLKKGAIAVNQTPLIKGVNNDPKILSELFKKLSFYGVPPYYVFQGRPVIGNKPFIIPVEKGYSIFLKSLEKISGLAKRPKFVMSHRTGKIEISALTKDHIIFRYHRAARDKDYGKFFIYKRNPEAFWFDDYSELIEKCKY
ncbi:MAG: KamA family radical SAM protein [Thermotogota bacterium]